MNENECAKILQIYPESERSELRTSVFVLKDTRDVVNMFKHILSKEFYDTSSTDDVINTLMDYALYGEESVFIDEINYLRKELRK